MLAHDTSLFSTVADPNATANQINNEMHNINTCAHQRQKNFNPGTSKPGQDVIFSLKIKVVAHPELLFNKTPVHNTSTQKHLGIFLDYKLNFQEHLGNMLNKVNKNVGLLQRLQSTLPRSSLLIECESLDHTLIMTILSMIKHIMHLFNKKSKAFSVMHL